MRIVIVRSQWKWYTIIIIILGCTPICILFIIFDYNLTFIAAKCGKINAPIYKWVLIIVKSYGSKLLILSNKINKRWYIAHDSVVVTIKRTKKGSKTAYKATIPTYTICCLSNCFSQAYLCCIRTSGLYCLNLCLSLEWY